MTPRTEHMAFEEDILDTPAEGDEDMSNPADVALAREVSATYGDDFERRLADLEAGRHPYQRAR
ncbi:MAG: hypothetical protein QM820_60235 [Minicystis sp.]